MGWISNLFTRSGSADGLVPKTVPKRSLAPPGTTSEQGNRATPENAAKYLYRQMWVDSDLRQRVLDIRDMDARDGRVKKIHKRTAAMVVKGGLALSSKTENRRVKRAWDRFEQRLGLHRREKLQSDARGLLMEGNLAMQWVLDGERKRVLQGVRMPSETLIPRVLPNGTFADPAAAYDQHDLSSGTLLARFALWQLTLGRIDPDNYDDAGSFGRPYLDGSREVWKKLVMTEEDLVLRRRMRAPQRMSHVLEGASEEDLMRYRNRVESDQAEGITTDYYLNKKGGVTALGGDANLDQIADVAHLLDTFFAGSPAPKGLFGFAGDLNRDILEDLKRDFFEEVDALQDIQSQVYQTGFELQLLLDGMDPENFDFQVQFAERRTETANQAADRALKWQALGVPERTVYELLGLDVEREQLRRAEQQKQRDPYPDPTQIKPQTGNARVSITPGNARKGESGTSISNPAARA